MERVEAVFLENLQNECGLPKGASVLLGVSGGVDSVCLLHLFVKYQELLELKLGVAHVNHNLREGACERDVAFVEQLCAQYRVPFSCLSADIKEISRERKISLEAAGREVRYSFFQEVMERDGYSYLGLGHHKNDQSETILMHILRGTGLKGLAGMKFKNSFKLRPLLNLSKEELLKYAKNEGLDFVYDQSNGEDIYLRNKLRLKIIPQLKELNPNFEEGLYRLGTIAGYENSFIDEEVEKISLKHVRIDESGIFLASEIRREHQALRLRLYQKIYQILNQGSLENRYLKEMDDFLLKDQREKLPLPKDNVFVRLEQGFVLRLPEAKPMAIEFLFKVEAPGVFPLPNGGRLEVSIGKFSFSKVREASLKECYFSYHEASWPLIVRNRCSGDEMVPFGARKLVSLKELMIKRKVKKALRGEIPVIFNRDRTVVFVPFLGLDQRMRIKGESEQIVHISYKE